MSHTLTKSTNSHVRPPSASRRTSRPTVAVQHLTLTLDGITAGDYLQWARDPEPPALGLRLRSIEVDGEPLGDTVEALLSWSVSPPPAIEAGPAAGLPLTPEVIAVRSSAAG